MRWWNLPQKARREVFLPATIPAGAAPGRNIKSVMGLNLYNMIGFILNIPWSVMGLLAGIVSVPKTVAWNAKSYAVIMTVKSLWWAIGYMKGARAMAIGHIVLLGPKIEE